jgi:hypothetical protein
METLVNFRTKWMYIIGMVLFLPLFGGCQENGMPRNVLLLSQIDENPGYASLPLIGTEWKLVGFADKRKNRIKEAEPKCGSCYIIIFQEDGTITGETSTNQSSGMYQIIGSDNNGIKIVAFSNSTEINELFDGKLFIECMQNVNVFSITPKGLELYYEVDKFLLFQPFE